MPRRIPKVNMTASVAAACTEGGIVQGQTDRYQPRALSRHRARGNGVVAARRDMITGQAAARPVGGRQIKILGWLRQSAADHAERADRARGRQGL